jgi:NADPH:quinone reductase-like Zn-dependent oxidoreductase
MRAVIVKEYGGTPVVAEIPTPQPGPHQVLIKLRAAGVNPMDGRLASGAQPSDAATFPMVLGADGAGIVEQIGEGETRFSPGDRVFGQLWAAPFVEAGTDAEYVAVSEDAALARVPDGLDFVVAAALPTTGMTGLLLAEELKPLDGKTVLIVGAGGGVGSFATQFAVNAGAFVIANVRSEQAERLRGYGATETVDHTRASLADTVRQAHPDGVDVLIDVASDADGFSALASLVRRGGTAVTTQFVADVEALKSAGITGINFGLQASPALLERVANAVVTGQIVAPPITRIALDEVPALLSGAKRVPDGGKTVITL